MYKIKDFFRHLPKREYIKKERQAPLLYNKIYLSTNNPGCFLLSEQDYSVFPSKEWAEAHYALP